MRRALPKRSGRNPSRSAPRVAGAKARGREAGNRRSNMKTTEVKLADSILDQLEREGPRTKRVLEKVPEGRDDWKPHEKSMPLGKLAMLVATMPSWVGFIVNQDELDVAPAGGASYEQRPMRTAAALVAAHDKAMNDAREVLRKATDEQLSKDWKL